mgnify:CR=1 FL=1
MKSVIESLKRQKRRTRGLRKRLFGTTERPRLRVHRTCRNISVQVIDDLRGITLCSASTLEKSNKKNQGGNQQAAGDIGRQIAKRAKEIGIEKVVFDRGGCLFHGRVKALAAGAREEGLQF